jgi:hypothetical protein
VSPLTSACQIEAVPLSQSARLRLTASSSDSARARVTFSSSCCPETCFPSPIGYIETDTTFDRSGHVAPHMSLKFRACFRGQSAVISSGQSNSLGSMP